MKNNRFFFVTAVLGFAAIFSFASPAKAQISPSLNLYQIAQDLKTPDAIARYLWRNFSFEDDQRQFRREEYWQTPQEFLQNRKGDCEDFALMAQALLKALGFKAFILNVYGSGFAHTICVFEEGGKYQAIDTDRVVRYGANNLEELSREIHPLWKKSAVVAPSPTSKNGRIVKLIERAQQQKHFGIFA